MARRAVPGALSGGPGRGYAHWSLQELAGSTFAAAPGCSRGAEAAAGLEAGGPGRGKAVDLDSGCERCCVWAAWAELARGGPGLACLGSRGGVTA